MKPSRHILLILVLAAAVVLGWRVYARLYAVENAPPGRDETRPAPIVTAPIETSPIALERTFSGTLEADAEFVAASKVGGIVEQLAVNLGDRVARGQLVAKLDDEEFVQSVAQAEAELKVAQANLGEARNLLEIAERELARVNRLSEQGLSSPSQRDVAQAEQLAKQAHVQVTLAQLARAEAQLQTAHIRRAYTEVKADWRGDEKQRVVAERYVDEGETVSANTPLLKIVKLDPIIAVIFVTEKEYASLKSGQRVSLTTDAYPDMHFPGVIRRIAPVFREATRQARVEIEVDNSGQQLKPGMFVRTGVVLAELGEATVIPFQALTRRDGQAGVFVLAEDRQSVNWREVEAGIRQGERLQVTGEGLQGEVVILGQQLLDDGSAVLLTKDSSNR